MNELSIRISERDFAKEMEMHKVVTDMVGVVRPRDHFLNVRMNAKQATARAIEAITATAVISDSIIWSASGITDLAHEIHHGKKKTRGGETSRLFTPVGKEISLSVGCRVDRAAVAAVIE